MGTTAKVGTFGTRGKMAEAGTFGTKGRLAGEPKKQRDSEDGTETIEINLGGGSSLGGVEVMWADGNYAYIPVADILEDYDDDDYWSIVFDVTNNTFDKTYTFDSTSAQWDDTGTSQTVYRLRVITQDQDATSPSAVPNSVYGQYRESIICRDGEPVTVLTKSS